MFFSYLLAKRMQPRYAVLAALLVGCLIAGISGLLDFQRVSLQVAVPVWTTPAFSLAAIFSIGLPLFVIAMASQNIPGQIGRETCRESGCQYVENQGVGGSLKKK